MNEITAPASEVIQITVQGKQNSNTWGSVTRRCDEPTIALG